MKKETIMNLLVSAGAAIEAALSLLEEEGKAPECKHPPDSRQDLSTMGHERWKCKLCGYIHDPGEEGS